MRADRLLSILLLLQVHQRITAHELAKRLEVSERTIHRDMDALSIAGIPVLGERGSGGGWSLLAEYRTNLTGLSEAEIQTLFLTSPSRILNDLGLRKTSEGALIKLLAALPAMHRHDAEYARQRIYIDSASWHTTDETLPALPILQEAIWQERRVLLTYQRSTTASERLLDPLGLVAKGSTWYLVAACAEQLRTYRVSRIQSLSITDEACIRPANFDLAAYWTQSSANFKAALPRYPVTVRMTETALARTRLTGRFMKIEHADPPDLDGWCKLHLLFDVEDEALGLLMSFGSQVEILAPPELRAQVIRCAENVLACYKQSTQTAI